MYNGIELALLFVNAGHNELLVILKNAPRVLFLLLGLFPVDIIIQTADICLLASFLKPSAHLWFFFFLVFADLFDDSKLPSHSSLPSFLFVFLAELSAFDSLLELVIIKVGDVILVVVQIKD